MARIVSRSERPVSSVPAFVARAAGELVGDPAAPDYAAAFGGDPFSVGIAAAAFSVKSAVAAHGGWAPADLVAPAVSAAGAAGLPAGSAAADGSFLGLVQSWRSPAEYLSGLVGDLVLCNGSLALLESRGFAVSAVLAAFQAFGLVSAADAALVRSQVAAVSAAVAADVAARVGRNF